MDKTIKLFKKALQSDREYKCSLTEPINILWDAYKQDTDRFDELVSALKIVENAYKS